MAYSEHARRYLADTGLPKERTYVTGSPMAEVLHQNLEKIVASDIHQRLSLEKGKYILLSAHREENIDTEKNFMEGSLKMKEISYIHSEAYAAGELKHGTISLIEDDILVVGVLTRPELYEKTISNMLECKSRGAYLMGLTTFGKYNIEDTADFTVYIPKTDPLFVTSLAVIPLQLEVFSHVE